MNNLKIKDSYRVFLWIGFISAVFAISFFIFHIPEIWPQLLAIIASAFLGAGVTAWITKTLLKSQQESEETKEKNIKVFENKIQVYSVFISKMWNTLEDDEVKEEEIREIRSDIFKRLIFYINDKSLPLLVEKIKNIKRTDNCQDSINKIKMLGDNIACFSEITELLRADAHDTKCEPEKLKKDIHDLWKNFGLQPREIDNISQREFALENAVAIETNSNDSSSYLHNCFWHFSMLGAEEQLKALSEGLYELNLVEYGEQWRTNLIKQVDKNNLVFLFRSGGWGYMGVYLVKGWRVFESEDNNVTETLTIFGEPQKVITDNNLVKEDLEKSDIYNSFDDGASLCSSIIVEPLAFSNNAIGNPGGVYRRTISRYDFDYGKMQLARFMTIMEDENDYNVYNGVKMGCNKELFKMILDNYNIKKASRDDKGNWQS